MRLTLFALLLWGCPNAQKVVVDRTGFEADADADADGDADGDDEGDDKGNNEESDDEEESLTIFR